MDRTLVADLGVPGAMVEIAAIGRGGQRVRVDAGQQHLRHVDRRGRTAVLDRADGAKAEHPALDADVVAVALEQVAMHLDLLLPLGEAVGESDGEPHEGGAMLKAGYCAATNFIVRRAAFKQVVLHLYLSIRQYQNRRSAYADACPVQASSDAPLL